MKPSIAIVLAGGLGTRLRAAVSDRPKPLADINGVPFLLYLINYWIDQGITRFILCTGYMSEKIEAAIPANIGNAKIDISQETTPLGTGGAILQALDRFNISENFIVLNGDTFFAVDLEGLWSKSRCFNSSVAVALMRTEAGDRYLGLDVNDNEDLINATAQLGEKVLCNGGVYLIRAGTLPLLNSEDKKKQLSFENEILQELMMKDGCKVIGVEFLRPFIDIGTPDDYHSAKQLQSLTDWRSI